MPPPPPATQLTVALEVPGGARTVHTFDAAEDRRVIIGRAPSCDLVLVEGGCSRKHAMLRSTQAGWVVEDLGSSNGTLLNGRVIQSSPLEQGDVVQIGRALIHLVSAAAPQTRLVVELLEGHATLDTERLPLSAAELIWFGFLSLHRATGAGWVVAGKDGHPQLRAFAAALLERAWALEVKSQPLRDLARGEDVDDEDLKNLRGKTAQKLRAFCAGSRGWMAALLVPEVSGKNLQRLPLTSAAITLLGAPGGNVAERPAPR